MAHAGSDNTPGNYSITAESNAWRSAVAPALLARQGWFKRGAAAAASADADPATIGAGATISSVAAMDDAEAGANSGASPGIAGPGVCLVSSASSSSSSSSPSSEASWHQCYTCQQTLL